MRLAITQWDKRWNVVINGRSQTTKYLEGEGETPEGKTYHKNLQDLQLQVYTQAKIYSLYDKRLKLKSR